MARAEGEEDRDGGGRDRPVWKDHDLHVVWGITLMSILGTSSVPPAFQEIVQTFGISQVQVVF